MSGVKLIFFVYGFMIDKILDFVKFFNVSKLGKDNIKLWRFISVMVGEFVFLL